MLESSPAEESAGAGGVWAGSSRGGGADQAGTATQIALRPHDPRTGAAIDKSEIVKGYEYDRGQFVTFYRR